MKRKLFVLFSAFALLLGIAIASFAQKCTEDGAIRRVTKSRVGNFETVTFEVNSDSPDYTVENARPPFTYSESDDVVRVRGKVFKTIQFKSVFWTCTIAENFRAATIQIMDVKNIEQFEGYVGYAIGYRKRSKYVGTTQTHVGKKTMVVMKFRR